MDLVALFKTLARNYKYWPFAINRNAQLIRKCYYKMSIGGYEPMFALSFKLPVRRSTICALTPHGLFILFKKIGPAKREGVIQKLHNTNLANF